MKIAGLVFTLALPLLAAGAPVLQFIEATKPDWRGENGLVFAADSAMLAFEGDGADAVATMRRAPDAPPRPVALAPDPAQNGRSLRFTITAKNNTSAIVKGFFRVPGVGKVNFGANGGQPGCILATPKRPVVEVAIPIPDGALNPAGKGLDCELQVIPGDWGRNLPIDVDISPISIIDTAK